MKGERRKGSEEARTEGGRSAPPPLFYSPERVCKDLDVSISLNFNQFSVVFVRDKKVQREQSYRGTRVKFFTHVCSTRCHVPLVL